MRKSKFLSALLSVVIALGLWLYVITTISPNSENTIYNIPVVLEGESILKDRNLMITYQSASSVSLTLSGNRSDLYKVDQSNITVKANVANINEPGTMIPLQYTVTYPGTVASNAFVEESKSPDTIYVTVEKRVNKKVPVEIQWVGTTPEGFLSDRENKVLDYSEITVEGPASVADQITKAVIEVDLSEQTESIDQSYRYTLCDDEGNPVDAQTITTDVAEVRVQVKIQRVQELKLTLDVIYGGGATPVNTKIEISPASIRVTGGDAVLEELGDTRVLGQLDLSQVEKSTEGLIYSITLPEGVTNETGVTEATVNVTFTGLSSKELSVDDIRILNLPEGMEADIITEKLTVVVRGPTADIVRLTEDDVYATVDLTGAELGTTTFKANIVISDAFPNVGVVRTYSVSATLQEK